MAAIRYRPAGAIWGGWSASRSSSRPLFGSQQQRQVVARQDRAEQRALDLVAEVRPQPVQLVLRLHARRRHPQAQGPSEADQGLGDGGIPKFAELNKVLGAATGWTLVGVEGLLPELDFFDHLANRRFPVTWWIRRPDQIDYIAEPDLFHDLFGHVPLLMNPVFADYMEAYGRGGVKAHVIGPDALQNLTRLYWYTVEFGLIDTPDGLRIYGAGIVSSKGESLYSLESDAPNRIGFDLQRIMRTKYRIDTFQKTYFVIDSFEQLMQATSPDFTPIYAALADQAHLPAGDVQDDDRVFQKGTGEGWADGGDV